MVEIVSIEDFISFKAAEGYIVILDDYLLSKIHKTTCCWVREDYFKTKIIENKGKNGKYIWVERVKEAFDHWELDKCKICMK